VKRPTDRECGGLWRTEIVRAVLSGHSILGIAFAAVIYIVCLSGTVAVFTRDFQRWEQPAAPVVTHVPDAAVDRAIADMARRAGPDTFFYVALPSKDLPRLILSTGNDDDDETWIADADGRLAVQQQDPWTRFLVGLHTELHLPEGWGRFVVGLAGVALLSSLISGVLAHPRIFRDAFHLRLGGSRRLEQADLHNRLGVWPLPFHVLVSLTGALLGLSTVIVGVLALLVFRGDSNKVYALLAPPPAKLDARPAPMPNIARILAYARERAPGAEPRQITITHWGRADMRLDLAAARPRLIAQQDKFTFDANGHAVVEKHPADLTVGERILGSLGSLHFGWFGGVVIRIAYGLLGLALCIVTSSGITVWLARRRDKGRAAPHWERLWASISWGQPVAIAATGLAGLLLSGQVRSETLTAIWAGLTILFAIGASALVSTPAAKIDTLARSAIALLLAAIIGLHLALDLRPTYDPGAYLVDAILGGAMIMLARPLSVLRGIGLLPREPAGGRAAAT